MLEVLEGGEKYLIVTHNNPDPDAVASSFALQQIMRRKLKKHAAIGYAGMVGRAENRALIKCCRIKLTSLESIDVQQFDRICLVDSQFNATNHSLPRDIVPAAVIDHHPSLSAGEKLLYEDVRPQYGATSTMLTEYVIDLELKVNKRVATALLFGIRSDTFHLSRRTTSADIRAYGYLVPNIDRKLLSMIENPALPKQYFRVLHRALENAKIFEDVVVAELERIDNPDAVAEMADFLLRLSGVSWSIVIGYYRKKLYISLRTGGDSKDAGQVIVKAVEGRGTAGGHDVMAGGVIPLDKKEDPMRVARSLRSRLLEEISASAKNSRSSNLIS